MNEGDISLPRENFWKTQIMNHKIAFVFVLVACLVFIISAVSVLIWYMETSAIGGYGSWSINQWSLKDVIIFMIILISWELLLAIAPAGVLFFIGGYLFWWKRLTPEEKQEYRKREGKKNKKTSGKHGGGNILSFLLFIAFCIYIFIDGNFSTPFGELPYSYFIYAYLYTIMWLLIIFGIPIAIILTIAYFKAWRYNK